MKDSLYNIETYGADYTVEHIHTMYERGDLFIPEFQRKYVWSQPQASKFIESCILGLPVPPVFFFKEEDSEKYLVVDGQQRIQSIVHFKKGFFRKPNKAFKLTGISDEYNGLTYESLPDNLRRRFDYQIIRVSIFKQTHPSGNIDSVYEVFSRLNTGGTKLTSHEVRNAIIRGTINDFLRSLNANKNWRELYGKKEPDLHMKDEEIILRFLALSESIDVYKPGINKFLNDYMEDHKNERKSWQNKKKELFEDIINMIKDKLGPNAFKLRESFNAALSDSLFIAFSRNLNSTAKEDTLRKGFKELKENQEFLDAVEKHTSDTANLLLRFKLAEKYLFKKSG